MSLYNLLLNYDTQQINELIDGLIKQTINKHKLILERDISGRTILFTACMLGHLKILKLVIEKGNLDKNDIMTKDNYGQTVLHFASYYGHMEITKLLIEKGNLDKIDIMNKDNYFQTALHLASVNGNLEIVKLLIEKGNLDKFDIEERTILNAKTQIIRSILSFEKSIFDYLQEKNYIEVLKLCKINYKLTDVQLSDICCLCINPEIQENLCKTTCGHTYCLDCYINYYHIFKQTDKCALCRSQLDNSLIIYKHHK